MRYVQLLTLLFVGAIVGVDSQAADVPTAGAPPVAERLTPEPGPAPRINGAAVFGARPGAPVLLKVAATGQKPLRYAAAGLPAGLCIDSDSGVISGRVEKAGQYRVSLDVHNSVGKAARALLIKIGADICLTPPMGWNSWNCWNVSVDQDKVIASARAMVDKGLIDHGWTYINIDDTWQGLRSGKDKALQANEKFPDMKALCDRVHKMGLKIGIYSTPWITSYAGYCGGSSDSDDGAWSAEAYAGKNKKAGHRVGKYPFDQADAQQWAAWGFDYLKYDWRPNDVPSTQRMADALRVCGRDIVYSLSNCAPLEHAADYFQAANCYRTTGDIRDDWRKGAGFDKFVGITDIWDFQEKWRAYCGPGHYPDPDMLVVGKVGWRATPLPSKLTADEQYVHISLWCLWCAPLLIGCPIEQMDDFTLGLLTNDEVLEVSQDSLCQMAKTVADDGTHYVLVKKMEDGSLVVGLLNRGEQPEQVTADWQSLGLAGKQRVRDLWRQKDLGNFDGHFTATVNRHGVVLLRLTAAKAS
jgi:alpha-galactosidase